MSCHHGNKQKDYFWVILIRRKKKEKNTSKWDTGWEISVHKDALSEILNNKYIKILKIYIIK